MLYKFVQKAVLNQKTTIGDQTFNKGETVFRMVRTEPNNCNQEVYLKHEAVKNMLQSGVKIQGLKLDAIGRIIEDKTKNFTDMVNTLINVKLRGYLENLNKAGGTFTYKPSLYNGNKVSLTDVFDVPTFRILGELFRSEEFNFDLIRDQMTSLLGIGNNTNQFCRFGLYSDEAEENYTNRFECSKPEQVLDMLAEAVRFKTGYRYHGDIAQYDIDDIATNVLIDNLEQYYIDEYDCYLRSIEVTPLQYTTGYVKIPAEGSEPAAYKEVVDYIYNVIVIERTHDLDYFIEQFLKKNWTLADEVNKYKKSVKILKHIGAEYEKETGNKIPGADGYIEPKSYIKDIVEKAKKSGIYNCNADEHAALICLITSTNKKNLELVDLGTVRIKSLGIEVNLLGQTNAFDPVLRDVVKYIGN